LRAELLCDERDQQLDEDCWPVESTIRPAGGPLRAVIADDCSKDWIEREGPDGKNFRVFDQENFRRSKRQMGALQWRISKLTPKRYHWMRWGPLRMP
jgi:hypothetical protein